MDRPLVSIIMALKDGEKYLDDAIGSILSQSYSPFEIILIDGQSVDNTAEIAKSYQQIRYYLQDGLGIANAYNQGIELSKGNLIAFQSSDDLWTQEKLNIQVEFMLANPEIMYSVGMVKHFIDDGCNIPAAFDEEFLHKEIRGLGVETLMARKDFFDQIGKFSSDYQIAEDLDLYARAIDQQIPMAVIPELFLYKRVHDASVTVRNAKQYNRILLRIMHSSIKRKAII